MTDVNRKIAEGRGWTNITHYGIGSPPNGGMRRCIPDYEHDKDACNQLIVMMREDERGVQLIGEAIINCCLNGDLTITQAVAHAAAEWLERRLTDATA